MRLGIATGLVLLLGGPALAQDATLILEATPPGGTVTRGQTVEWRLFIEVSPNGSRGLAGMAADLVSDLPRLAPGFEFSRAVNVSPFPTQTRELDLGPTFVNQINLGTRLPRDGLATLQTIGGTQDTVDNVAATRIINGQPAEVPSGMVIEGVGQTSRKLAARGSFVVPQDAAAGNFFLRTGAVPGNPGQTKVNLLVDIQEVTRDGNDSRWSVVTLSPVPQQGDFTFTISSGGGTPPGGGGTPPGSGGGGTPPGGNPPPDDPNDPPPDDPNDPPPGSGDPPGGGNDPPPSNGGGNGGNGGSGQGNPDPGTGNEDPGMPGMPPPICGLGIEAFGPATLFGLAMMWFVGRRRYD